MFKISKGYENVPKTFRIPIFIIERLDALAFKNNISVNCLVIQCLEYALENLDETEENHKCIQK